MIRVGYFDAAKATIYASTILSCESFVVDIPQPDFIVVSVNGKEFPVTVTDECKIKVGRLEFIAKVRPKRPFW